MVSFRVSGLGLAGLVLGVLACGGGPEYPTPTTPPPAPALSTTAVVGKTPALVSTPIRLAPRSDASLIAREVLFGNPDRAAPQLSRMASRFRFLRLWMAS